MKILFILLFLSSLSYADDSSVHDWDHFGTSYAAQTFMYGFGRQAFQMNRSDAFAFGFFTTFLATFTYEMFKAGQNKVLDTHTLGINALGQAASVGTCLMFKF